MRFLVFTSAVVTFAFAAGTSAATTSGSGTENGVGGFPLLYTVGSDAACTHSDLQSAIDDARLLNAGVHDFIHVARNHDDTAITADILGHDLTIVGGFPTCADSTRSGSTSLSGGDGSVIAVRGVAGSDQTLILQNLRISGGGAIQGGGLHLSGPVSVHLENVEVSNNEADLGGGIYIDGSAGAQLELTDASAVVNNEALEHGGGIFCIAQPDAGALVILGENVGVTFNRATFDPDGDGGGIVISGGCELESRAGGLFAGIFLNQAADQGGGLVVDDGATARLVGGAAHAAMLYNNTARQGGGAYVDDEGSRLETEDSWILSNVASEDGGGVFVNDGGALVMNRVRGSACHDPVRCSRLSLNHAGEAGSKGAAAPSS